MNNDSVQLQSKNTIRESIQNNQHSNSSNNQSDHIISMSYLAVNLFNSFYTKYDSEHDSDKSKTKKIKIDQMMTKKKHQVPAHKSAMDKQKARQMKRDELEKLFDQYIDPDENWDVDVDEWLLGIKKLNIELSETEMRKIFHFMDKDESGYIEKNDFVLFAVAKFDSIELCSLQSCILRALTDNREFGDHNSISNSTPSMVIKHRTDSSIGNHLDLVNRMVSRWGCFGDDPDAATDDLTKITTHDEINLIKMKREALEQSFDQYLDPDQNGDVDIEEWFLGIQKLTVQLNATQQRRIFNFIDKDEDGFIEKNDFVVFGTTKFDNVELRLLQKPILETVGVQNLHNRTHSNFMNGDGDANQDWSDYDMQLLEQEMARAMTGMVETMKCEMQTYDKQQEDTIELCIGGGISQDWTDYDMQLLEQEMASAMTEMVNVETTCMKSEMGTFDKQQEDTIELCIGGGQDINTFRNCLEANIMPSIDSITYNGLLNEYYFATNSTVRNNITSNSMMFYPSYCYAKIRKFSFETNTYENEYEYYMCVGLKSNIKQQEFKRKNLNLLILLDTSNSMSELFDCDKNISPTNLNLIEWRKSLKIGDKIDVNEHCRNQYCWYGCTIVDINKKTKTLRVHYNGWNEKYDENININSDRLAPYNSINTKLKCAKDAIISMLKQLTNNDRICIISFQRTTNIIQKFEFIKDVNMNNLTGNILNIAAVGGTHIGNALRESHKCFKELFEVAEFDMNLYDNRVMVLSDARSNEGMVDCYDLKVLIRSDNIFTSFIGVGLNFNNKLIELITQTRGCNYFSVKSSKQFDDKINEEFEYMVTPLFFNVCLKLKCEGNLCQIQKVYGSGNGRGMEDVDTEEINYTKIHTLFAAKKSTKIGKAKGGIQLIKLKKKCNGNENINVELVVTFEDRNGKKYENTEIVTFNAPKLKQIENNDMIENDEKETDEIIVNDFYDNTGIRKAIWLCKYVEIIQMWIEQNNYSSFVTKPLTINQDEKKIFANFLPYFQKQTMKCHDTRLEIEMNIINKLIHL